MLRDSFAEEQFKMELLSLFSDMNAEGLSRMDTYLYQRILKYSASISEDIDKLIHSWGFQYKGRKNFSMSLEDILRTTHELYPEKVITSMTDYKNDNDTMYQRLVFLLKREKTPSEFLMDNDYIFKNRLQDYDLNRKNNLQLTASKIGKYDKVAITELINNYEFNMSEFAKVVGVSRQAISKAPESKEVKQGLPLFQEIMEEEEIKIVFKTIDKRVFKYEENGCYVRLIKKQAGTISPYNDIAIIIANESNIKCYLNLPDFIDERMNFKGLYNYNEKDIKILNYMDDNTKSWEINRRDEIEFFDIEYYSLISAGLKLFQVEDKDFTKKEYIYHLTGYYPKTQSKSDSEILEIIQRNVYDIKNRFVHISSMNEDKSDYLKLRRAVKHRRLSSVPKLVESFGYIFKPKPRANRDVMGEHIDIIKEFYVVKGDKVYLKPGDMFTNRINTYAYKKKKNLVEYLRVLGFTKISKDDLPDGYIYRSYQKSKRKSSSLIEQVLLELQEIEVDNIIDLADTKLNFRIRKVANMQDKTLDEFLDLYGYIRKDKQKIDAIVIKSEEVAKEDEEDEEYFKGKLLKEIKKIQGTLNVRIQTQDERIERSQALVAKLKRLYNYQCQLCDPEGIDFQTPIIEMKNGHAYVELHHIVQLANASKAEDESLIELDKYTNAIVLCSHHHKYVHFHKDGYKSLYRNENDEVCLKSEDGYYLKLYLNVHLLID